MAHISNKKVKVNYEILEVFCAGLELIGTEVKSIKIGKGSLQGAVCVIRGGEAFLVGANIPAYQEKNVVGDYDPSRTRKLLLNKKEILSLEQKLGQKGLTLVPISIYTLRRKLKIDIGLARKKKLHDKREAIKKRESDRERKRAMKSKAPQ